MKDFDGAEIIASLGDGLTLVRLERPAAAVEAARIGWNDFPGERCACIRDASRRTVAMFAYNGYAKANEAGFAPLKHGVVVPQFERLRPFVERIERAEHMTFKGIFKEGQQKFANGHTLHHKDWLPHRLDGPADEWTGGYAWFKDGIRHRDGDLPAHENSILKEWWSEGRRHRGEDKPAVESHRHKAWWQNGVRHRGGGEPAVEFGDVRREWWVEGKRHRDGDLPAFIAHHERRWYKNGRLHRDGGRPAVENDDGSVEHWVDGVQVGNRFLADWKAVSQALIAAMEMGANGKFESQTVATARRAGITHRINAVTKELEKKDGPNAISGPSVELLAAVRKACQRTYGNAVCTEDSEIKCLKLGAIVAAGRFSDLVAAERDSLLELIELMPKGRKWISLVSPGGPGNPPVGAPLDRDGLARLVAGATLSEAASPADGPVAFALEWLPPRLPGRKVWPHLTTTGHAILERVGEFDAPVVVTLPTDDGHSLDVRFIGGDFFRPVLAPGSFRPLSEAEFRTAAAAGVAWRDNPYRVKPKPTSCALAVDEIATAEKPMLAGKDAEMDAVSAAIARAGRLFVVDGQVYRRTVEPTIEMVKTRTRRLNFEDHLGGKAMEEGAVWRTAWRFTGDIAQADCQAVVVTSRSKVADWMAAPCSVSKVNENKRRKLGLTFPLPQHKEVESLLARTAARAARDKGTPVAFNLQAGKTALSPSGPIEVYDPSVFTATPQIHLVQISIAFASLEAKLSEAEASGCGVPTSEASGGCAGECGVARSKAADISTAIANVDLDHPGEVAKLCEDAVELVRAMDALDAKAETIRRAPYEMALLETAADILKGDAEVLDEDLVFHM